MLNKIDMVVVGQEDPLVNGIHDFFNDSLLQNVSVIGPQKAAELEGSKEFAKSSYLNIIFLLQHIKVSSQKNWKRVRIFG